MSKTSNYFKKWYKHDLMCVLAIFGCCATACGLVTAYSVRNIHASRKVADDFRKVPNASLLGIEEKGRDVYLHFVDAQGGHYAGKPSQKKINGIEPRSGADWLKVINSNTMKRITK